MATIYGAQGAFQALPPLWRQRWIGVTADKLMIQSISGGQSNGPVVIERQQDADWLIPDTIADKIVAELQPDP